MKFSEMERSKLEGLYSSSVNWFFWIGALSLINSGLQMLKVNLIFVIGLGYTQFIDGLVQASGQDFFGPVFFAGLAGDVIISGAFLFFGYASKTENRIALILGTILYAIDTIFVLLLGDFMSAAFHAFALFFLVRANIILPELKSRYGALVSVPEKDPVQQVEALGSSDEGILVNYDATSQIITKNNSKLLDSASMIIGVKYKNKIFKRSMYNEISVIGQIEKKLEIDRNHCMILKVTPNSNSFVVSVTLLKKNVEVKTIGKEFVKDAVANI